jgi:hypothetical protein
MFDAKLLPPPLGPEIGSWSVSETVDSTCATLLVISTIIFKVINLLLPFQYTADMTTLFSLFQPKTMRYVYMQPPWTVGMQAQDVIAAYAPFFENLHVADDSSGWALIYGTRLLGKL